MKKFFTLRNILICAGALVAVVAFFIAFAAGLKAEAFGMTAEVKGIILGTPKSVSPAGTHEDPTKTHAVLSLVGVIMMLVGGLAAVVVGLFFNKPCQKWVLLALAILILVGAVFAFMLKVSYAASCAAKQGGTTKECLDEMESYKLNAGAVFTGILGILGAGAIGVSAFLKQD